MIITQSICDKCHKEMRPGFYINSVTTKEESKGYTCNGIGPPESIIHYHYCNDCFKEIEKYLEGLKNKKEPQENETECTTRRKICNSSYSPSYTPELGPRGYHYDENGERQIHE